MRQRLILAGMYLLFLTPAMMGQSSPATSGREERSVAQGTRDSHPSTPTRTYRPKLPLQDALKIAEAYIGDNHIDISTYWLSQVRFILYGPSDAADKDKIPCWHFWWMNDSGAIGDYVEILVDMNGRAWRAPSM